MRLLDTESLRLHEFAGSDIPKNAILSHTWGADEVSFQAYSHTNVKASSIHGYAKIFHTCRLARAQGLRYAWMDTCCIDKTSSAELSEAINSMFLWYKKADICYAYLSDLPPQAPFASSPVSPSHGDHNDSEQLSRCRWFRCGWTLQELLAPSEVIFLDQTWAERGTKETLEDVISRKTNIDPEVLRDSSAMRKQPVSVRMSWAAGRETTRVEDTAYCMLGIFNVHMALLYGEGERAFTRLQREIIQHDSDLSIFCWSPLPEAGYFHFPGSTLPAVDNGSHDGTQLRPCGILAPSKEVFWGISPSASLDGKDEGGLKAAEFSLTNLGIKIHGGLLVLCAGACPSQECRCPAAHRKYFLPVQSGPRTTGSKLLGRYRGVFLEKLKPDLFVRSSSRIMQPDESTTRHAKLKASRPIYIATDAPLYSPSSLRSKLFIPQAGGCGSSNPSRHSGTGQEDYSIIAAAPQSRWHHCERGFFKEGVPEDQLWGLLNVRISHRSSKFEAFVLVRYQHHELVHILHSERRDIVITMRDSSGWVWDDVQFPFREELALREGDARIHVSHVSAGGEVLKVTACIGRDGLAMHVASPETALAAMPRGLS